MIVEGGTPRKVEARQRSKPTRGRGHSRCAEGVRGWRGEPHKARAAERQFDEHRVRQRIRQLAHVQHPQVGAGARHAHQPLTAAGVRKESNYN